MENIKGEPETFRVKESFCHPSYWENGEYGYLTNDGFGVLYACKKCMGVEVGIPEGYEFCEGCNCIISEFDVDYRALEEFGIVLCKECYLAEKGFPTETLYHQTDVWRGFNRQIPKDSIAIAWECCIISHEQNEEFVNAIYEWLEKRGYEYIHTSNQTSNVFSVNFQILAKKPHTLTEKEKEELKQLDRIATDYYTRGFSIFSGKTYEIDIERFKKEIEAI